MGLLQVQACQPFFGSCGIVRVSADAFNNICTFKPFVNFGSAVADGAAAAGAEGNDGFAAEVIAVGKGCYCHRRGVPPDGVTYKNNIILGHVFHFVFQRRAGVIGFFLFCKFRCFAVNGRIRGCGFDFENIGAGFALDKLRYFFGVAGMAEVGYKDFLPPSAAGAAVCVLAAGAGADCSAAPPQAVMPKASTAIIKAQRNFFIFISPLIFLFKAERIVVFRQRLNFYGGA